MSSDSVRFYAGGPFDGAQRLRFTDTGGRLTLNLKFKVMSDRHVRLRDS